MQILNILNFYFKNLNSKRKKSVYNNNSYFNCFNDLLNFKYIKTKHSWHLVDPSPWPFVASIGAITMTLGGVLYMHNFLNGGNVLICGILTIIFVMYTWWRDIIREATFEDQHTLSVQRGLRLGMILFIVSEIMFFFAFFWAFFHSSLSPVFNIGGIWPPKAITIIPTSGIPLTNTFFLLSSGATVTWAHHSIIVRAKKQSIIALIFTIILAILFTFLQGIEYLDAPFTISDSVYGSCFFFDNRLSWISCFHRNLFFISIFF